jgi:broad specificity phosphatase PhoE
VTTLHLVRHGEAASGWGGDLDPGLSDLGRRQAEEVTHRLALLGPMPILTSPLRRTRETAEPLAARWGVEPVVDPAVGEIVAPAEHAGLEARAAWLREAMAGTWSALGETHHAWRRLVVERLLLLEADTVVVTHFVAINVAVGAATGDDRVVCFAPGNCSVTTLRSEGGVLVVESLGGEARTQVL